jgi:hypothetical protein
MTDWGDAARAGIAQGETELKAAQDEIKRLQDELNKPVPTPDPTPTPTPSSSVYGFGGPDPTGKAKVLRVFLNPGDPFPKAVAGVTHFVTYKGAADHAMRAKQAKAYGQPVYLGFHHEPEGPGGADYSPTQYKAEWTKLGNALKAENATNVKTLWVMMAISYGSGTAASYYPGDALVDVVGGDGYDFCGCRPKDGGNSYAKPGSSHRSPSQIFGKMVEFSNAHNKKVAFMEIGTPQVKGNPDGQLPQITDFITYIDAQKNCVGATYFQHEPPSFMCYYTLIGKAVQAWAAKL